MKSGVGGVLEDVEYWEEDDGFVQIGTQRIPLALFEEAIRAGQLSADLCTSAHPRTAQGLKAYLDTTGRLRTELIIRKWKPADDKNIASITSEDGSVTIICSSGNEHTGLTTGRVATRNPRGRASVQAINRNSGQGEFEGFEDPKLIRITTDHQTWHWLFNRDGGIVRSEISLAIIASEDGATQDFVTRKILPPINLDEPGPDGPGSGSEVVEVPPTIDVDVQRRVAR